MKPVKKSIEEVLRQCLPSAAKDSREEIDALGVRALRQLRAASEDVEVTEEIREPGVSSFPWRSVVAASAAAAVLLVALIMSRPGSVAVAAENLDGALLRSVAGEAQAIAIGEGIEWGHTVHTNDRAGATFVLADGSRVEMRAASELALEQTNDGVRIRLSQGSVIVNAAKQRTGHLSVQTRDVAVSVVGTVFLVNAEEEGSRVAVIEGEVRVQHGTADKKLRRGEQVATGLQAEAQPVKEEISWSRNAEAHMALLQQPLGTATPAKTGSVTGIVRSAGGAPVSWIRVMAVRTDASDSSLRAMASLAQTDETGRYRLENIPPGTYYIAAGRIDLPTFFPATLDMVKGTVVSVSSAATITDIDIVVQDTSTLPAREPTGFVIIGRAKSSKLFIGAPDVNGLRTRVLPPNKVAGPVLDAAAWTDPVRAQRLGLTENQKREISAIVERHRQASSPNPSPDELDARNVAMTTEVLLILADPQRSQLMAEAAATVGPQRRKARIMNLPFSPGTSPVPPVNLPAVPK
jgi:ferric-dicitrate binding protein FerR (iron transport regulator)